jgi:hypothetical protein
MLARSYDLTVCARRDGSIYVDWFFYPDAACNVHRELVPECVGDFIASIVAEGWEFVEQHVFSTATYGSTHWIFHSEAGSIMATRPMQDSR